jgi:hypothetical protein
VLIDKREAEKLELMLLDRALDSRRRAVLRGGPQAVTLDKSLR